MAIDGGLRVGQLGVTLIVQDVARAADFYRDVLGAEELRRDHGEVPLVGWTTRSAELLLAGVYLTVSHENPRWREAPRPDWPRSPLSAGATAVGLTLYVEDVDAVFARAIAAGAWPHKADGVPEDTFWGDRVVQLHDPAGHLWRIQQRLEDVAPDDLLHREQAMRAGLQLQ